MSDVREFVDTLTLIGEFGDYDYSWWEFKAWYDPEARIYYWFEDSGCSCDSYMEYIESVGELEVGRKDELTRAASASGSDRYDGFTAFMDNLRRFDA